MGRELRRMALDFSYPMHTVWYGHFIDTLTTCIGVDGDYKYCEQCKMAAKIKGVPIAECGCPDWDGYLKEPIEKIKELLAPPEGEGYQLWSTTSEGSPISPVFATLDELCAWCADNATVFADIKVTKERWKELLTQFEDGTVIYDDNGILII